MAGTLKIHGHGRHTTVQIPDAKAEPQVRTRLQLHLSVRWSASDPLTDSDSRAMGLDEDIMTPAFDATADQSPLVGLSRSILCSVRF